MKKVTITLALVAALLTGCKSNKVALEQLRADVSWSAFCAARGYDINDNTYPVIMSISILGVVRLMKRPLSSKQE